MHTFFPFLQISAHKHEAQLFNSSEVIYEYNYLLDIMYMSATVLVSEFVVLQNNYLLR